MTRLLILLALALWIAYLVAGGLRRLRAKLTEMAHAPPVRRRQGEGELVACTTCGVHVPRSRALRGSGGDEAPGPRTDRLALGFYCSASCRQHPRAGSREARLRSA